MSEQIQKAVEQAKAQEQSTRQAISKAHGQKKDINLTLKEASKKVVLHIKDGMEKASVWYEEYMFHTMAGGAVIGSTMMIVANILAVKYGITGTLVALYVTGGWVLLAPFLFAILYFAAKLTIKLVRAAVNGIRKAHAHGPVLKKAIDEKIEELKVKLENGVDPTAETA